MLALPSRKLAREMEDKAVVARDRAMDRANYRLPHRFRVYDELHEHRRAGVA